MELPELLEGFPGTVDIVLGDEDDRLLPLGVEEEGDLFGTPREGGGGVTFPCLERESPVEMM